MDDRRRRHYRGETGRDRLKNLLGYGVAQQIRLQLPASMKVVALAERNHFFGKRTQFFRLRKRSHQPAVIEEVRHQVA